MPNHPGQSDTSGRSWWPRLAVVGLLAVGLAVAVNYVAMPMITRTVFSRTPAEHAVNFDERRKEVTRQVSAAIIAGMLGPAESSPPEALAEKEAPSSGGDEAAPEEASEPTAPDEPPEEPSEQATDDEPAASPSPEPAPEPEEPDEEETSSGDTPAPEPVPEGPLEFTVDRRDLNRRLRRPEQVRDKVSVISTRGPSGQYRGLRILEAGGWFGNWGLRPGDVVEAINGHRVTTRQQAVSMLMGMKQETRFTLKVVRHDNAFEIRYHIPHVDKQPD